MTMDVTVKTLDGQNKNFNVPEDITVLQFKERISSSINIEADVQRLIFQGRVLQDEKPLKDYSVHGKVIHVVQRPPPGSRPTTSNTGAAPSTGNTGGGNPNVNSFVVGSFTLPSDAMDPNQVQNIVQQAMNNLGDVGRNARVTTRASPDGFSVGVDISLGQVPLPLVASESTRRIVNARTLLRQAKATLDRLENPQDNNANSGAQSPMDTSNGNSPSTTDESTTASTSTNQSATSSQSSGNQSETSSQQDTNPSSTDGQRTEQSHPASTVLADLLDEVSQVNTRLQPHLEKYQSILRDERTYETESDERRDSQRVCNLVSEVLHFMSHCNHSISDLMIDLGQAPPRTLRAPPSTAPNQPTAIIRQAIPVDAQINIDIPRAQQQNTATSNVPPRSSATGPTSTNRATPTVSSTASTSSQTPLSQAGGPGLTSNGQTSTASSNPYVFMEVGPDSVTINSISAHVVTSTVDGDTNVAEATSTTNTGTQSSATSSTSTTTANTTAPPSNAFQTQGGQPIQMDPNFMQNMIQMMAQSMSQGMAGGQPVMVIPGTTTVNGNSSATAPRTATTTTPGSTSATPASAATTTTTTSGQRTPWTGTGPIPGTFGTFVPRSNVRVSSGTTPRANSAPRPGTPGVNVRLPMSAGGIPAVGIRIPHSGPPGQANQQTQGGRPAFVLPMGGVQMGGLPLMGGVPMTGRPVDPFLPCMSRHFITLRAQAMAAAHAQAQNPESSLADVVTNLVQGLIGQQVPLAGGASAEQTETPSRAPPGAANTHTTPAQPGPIPANPFSTVFPGLNVDAPGGPTSQPNVPFAQLLRGVLQSQAPRSTASSSSTSTSSTTTTAGTGSSQQTTSANGATLSDEAFTDLISGISQYVTRSAMGEQPQDSIAEFLNRLGQSHNILPSEGFVNDVFMCLASRMTFPDLISVFYGQSQPLNRLRGPLRQFIRENVLQGGEYNPRNVEVAVNRLVDELQPSLEVSLEGASIRPGVDAVATVNNFTRQQLTAVINLILQNRSDDPTVANFGGDLLECCRRIIAEFITLSRYCLADGMPAFERIVQERLRHITEDINPMIQRWMVAMSSQQLAGIAQTIQVSEESVQRYVVAPSTVSPAVSSSVTSQAESTVTSSERLRVNTPRTTPRPVSAPEMGAHEAMEVECQLPQAKMSASLTTEQQSQNATAHTSSSTTPATRTSASGVRGDEWRSLVPADWVPIIAADVERQRRQAPQGPYSDAYLNGMPSKRRKMMTQEKPSEDLSQESEFIPEALKRAVAAAGVEPISSLENMVAEASEDRSLQVAFQGQVEDMIRDRIQTDSDFTSDKYPNSREYFKQDKK